jgi:hypothetical protein
MPFVHTGASGDVVVARVSSGVVAGVSSACSDAAPTGVVVERLASVRNSARFEYVCDPCFVVDVVAGELAVSGAVAATGVAAAGATWGDEAEITESPADAFTVSLVCVEGAGSGAAVASIDAPDGAGCGAAADCVGALDCAGGAAAADCVAGETFAPPACVIDRVGVRVDNPCETQTADQSEATSCAPGACEPYI